MLIQVFTSVFLIVPWTTFTCLMERRYVLISVPRDFSWKTQQKCVRPNVILALPSQLQDIVLLGALEILRLLVMIRFAIIVV